MHLVIEKATQYQNTVSKYEAEIYIKGRTEILKQNMLIRLAHHIFPIDRKNKDMLFEMVSQSKFNAPQNYLHDLKAVNGNSIPNGKKQQEALAFLNLNVYSPTAYDDAIFMPIASNAFKFYTFNLEGLETINGLTIYKIRFLPKQWSQKLVCGDLYVIDQDRYERSLLFRRIQPSHELRTGFQAVHPTREGGSIPPIQGIGKRGGNHLPFFL